MHRIAPLLLLLSACSSFEPSSDTGVLRADRDQVRASVTAEEVRFDVPFTYRNTTGETVELHGCITPTPPHLERREGIRWASSYHATVYGCLSPPLRVAPGQSHRATLDVIAGRGSSRIYPRWETPVAGTYRLR